ncbi:LAME_0F01508g1_1 [Lachancea meyersii CBS 8951]|uniref:LAME_0F01508g1_1 n=1 Tax=Lachancea meyersii CBS 8951 TaxID=1266667 RepID=A0A1G4JQ84_9SACH|nr:LAME_0F01508g1_1 [Lachancea meyersii CBS 8951]
MKELFDLTTQLACYKGYHSNDTNVQIHAVFVPLILFSSMVILHHVEIWSGWTLTHFLAATFAGYYLVLDLKAGALAACILASTVKGIDVGVLEIPVKWAVLVFATGWFAQFYGHAVFERRRPAVVDNLVQSLITAPFLILFELLFALGYYKALRVEIMQKVTGDKNQKPH